MVEMGVRLVLAAVLAGAALAKLANPSAGREALAGFGFESPGARAVGFWSLVTIELGLAVALVAGSTEAAILGAALMAMFALVMVSAIARGRAGEPCGCFGARSRIGWAGVLRNLALAGGFVAVAVLPSEDPNRRVAGSRANGGLVPQPAATAARSCAADLPQFAAIVKRDSVPPPA